MSLPIKLFPQPPATGGSTVQVKLNCQGCGRRWRSEPVPAERYARFFPPVGWVFQGRKWLCPKCSGGDQ